MLKSGGDLSKPINSIHFDLEKECKRNYFRLYSATMFENETSFICGAFFTSDDDVENLIGMPIIFALNQDIHEKTTWSDLYGSKSNALKYFYNTDLAHNGDDDADGSQPIIKATWLDSVKCTKPE